MFWAILDRGFLFCGVCGIYAVLIVRFLAFVFVESIFKRASIKCASIFYLSIFSAFFARFLKLLLYDVFMQFLLDFRLFLGIFKYITFLFLNIF